MRFTLPVLLKAHVYGAGVVGLFLVLLPSLARVLDWSLPVFLPPWVTYVGVPLLLASGALSYWSFLTLVRLGRGPAFPYDPPSLFVEAGPYRSVRNPMYVGNLGILFGLALVFTSSGMLLYALLMCGVTRVYVVSVEEPRLLARFGAEYAAYCQRIPRWVVAH